MRKPSDAVTLIGEMVNRLTTRDGLDEFIEVLDKVSETVTIEPPITLDKLMAVFGTNALLIQSNMPIGKELQIGRITTPQERIEWAESIRNIPKILKNRGLVKKLPENLVNIPLDSFAEDLVICLRVLFLEVRNVVKILPNHLQMGAELVGKLKLLTKVLAFESGITEEIKNAGDELAQEKQRISGKATEELLRNEFLAVGSSASYQAMREVVALNKFKKFDDTPYPTAFVERNSITGKIQLTPLLPTENIYGAKLKELEASMWQKREQLSDLHVDVIDAMCATWIVQSASEEGRAVITADDVLRLRGLKAHLSGNGRRGGYTMEQRQEIVNAVQDLENIWFEITEKRKSSKKTNVIQSRAIAVTDRGGQIRLDGNLDVMWFVFRPGSIFARYLLTEGRETALLAAQALRYNVRTQAVEKRLVRYLSWYWRISSESKSFYTFTVETLLKEVGIQVPKRNAHRACERLEKSLNRLLRDRIISDWQYPDWGLPNTKKQGWINSWLTTEIKISPPDFINESYQRIGQANLSPVIPINLETESEIAKHTKEKRKAGKLTQGELAHLLDISQATVSRIESGQKVSLQERTKIREWLER